MEFLTSIFFKRISVFISVSAIRLLNGNALWPLVVWFQNTKRETAKILNSRLHKSTAGSIIKTPHSLRQFLGCHQAWHS